METVNWGIIGCGDVTELKSGPAFNKVAGSRLVAVMRRDAAAAKDYAARHGVPRWYSDAQSLIDDPEVNAVYIATPPNAHASLALQVAAAGKPCYVEKPMARTAAECAQMVAAFEAASLPLFVAYYRRALPQFARVKALIESGELGELRQLNYEFACSAMLGKAEGWRYQPEVAGGGLFWDLGSHALDVFDFWLGSLTDVRGHMMDVTGNGQVEELVSLTAQAEGGVSLVGSWNFISPESVDRVTLRFSKGVVRCSIFGKPELSLSDASGHVYSEAFELPENMQLHLIEDVVASIRTGEPALSTGASALRTNQVIDSVAGGAAL